jgi:hypothetical protein
VRLHTAAQDRYDRRVPPGYSDVKAKGMPEACGDFIAWSQLMEISHRENKGMILVLDDLKEDWWHIERERTIGPRPELLEEFTRVTQQHIYLYNSENFLRAAKEFKVAEINEEVIEEVTQRLASQRETLRGSSLKLVIPSVPAVGKDKGSETPAIDSNDDAKLEMPSAPMPTETNAKQSESK